MTELRGIDVSSWNGAINWEQVKGSGVDFAILRAGAGDHRDVKLIQNLEGAARAGIPCGAYLYSYATTVGEATAEGKGALEALRPYSLAYPVFYDIEDKAQHGLSNRQRSSLVRAFCETLRDGGRQAGVYSSLWWLQGQFDAKAIRDYDKWVAQWGPSCSYREPYALWQHSSTGKVPGIAGQVDLNLCYKDYSAPLPEIPGKKYPVGTRVRLEKAALFATAAAPKAAGMVNGVYWLYDGQIQGGRVRITTDAARVGAQPAARNVTGFVAVQDLRLP